jgi:hypothetical protein
METEILEIGDRVEFLGRVGRLAQVVDGRWRVQFDDGTTGSFAGGVLAYAPDDGEIRQRCQVVRSSWSPAERQRRIVGPLYGWQLPVVDATELLGLQEQVCVAAE